MNTPSVDALSFFNNSVLMGAAYFCNHVSLINKDQFRPPFVGAVGVGIVFILIVEHIASTH